MDGLNVRLFVSSPADVAPERDRVTIVADRLNGEFEGIANVEVFRWEEHFYKADRGFQSQIPEAATCDIVLGVFWGRIGTEQPADFPPMPDGRPYVSGTAYELLTALEASKRTGAPDVYVFRKTADVVLPVANAKLRAEAQQQFEGLEAFWREWFRSDTGQFKAGFQTFDTTDVFEEQIENCLRRWLEHRGIIAKETVWDRRIKGSPFCGLAPFLSSHSNVFFGRDAAIGRAISKLRTASFLLLIGASGAGKSSLLRAGLMTRIVRPGAIAEIDLWRTAIIEPSSNPCLDLANAVHADAALGPELAGSGYSAAEFADLVLRSPENAVALIGDALRSAATQRATERRYESPRPVRLFLGIDQLERLFVETTPEQIDGFAGFLQRLLDAKMAMVAATLRSDAYARFQAFASLAALREAGATQDVLPPSAQELEEIVTRPVLACHPPLAFEIGRDGRPLAAVLVADAKGGDALPLLQMTLDRLFQAETPRGDGVLRFADYPGLDQAVTQAAAEAFEGLDAAAQAALPALITSLVYEIGPDPFSGELLMTLRPVTRSEFERGQPARAALVDAFVAKRLLTVEDSGGAVRVRPVHEALLRAWPVAAAIISENEGIIRVRRTLEPLTAHWIESGRSLRSDYLLTSPALLAGASELLQRWSADDVPEPMRAYIAASLAAEAQRAEDERRQLSTIRSATGAASLRSARMYVPLVVLLLAAAVVFRQQDPYFLQKLRLIAFDTYQRLSPAHYDPSLGVRIVDIDERSLRDYGQWPWQRTLFARMLKELTAKKAAAIAFDIQFSEPDQKSLEALIKELPPEDAAKFAGLLSSRQTNDQVFAAALQQSKSVIAVSLDARNDSHQTGPPPDGSGDSCPLEGFNKTPFNFGGTCPKPFIPGFSGMSVLPALLQAARGAGAADYISDPDMVVRRVGLVFRLGDRLVPSLAAEALRIARSKPNDPAAYDIMAANASGLTAYGQETGISYIDIGDLRVPTDPKGAVILKYRPSNPKAFIPAWQVLNGSVPESEIAGNIILVGTSAAGQVDLHPSPVDASNTGVEIQEQVVENILGARELVQPDYALALEQFIVVMLGSVFAVAILKMSPLRLAAMSGILFTMILIGGWTAYNYANVLIDPAYPIIALAVFTTIMTFYVYHHSETQRGRIREMFSPKEAAIRAR